MAFGGILRQSTAVDVLIGPFLDDTDGKTSETGLTIAQSDVKLSKNGQTLAQKNDNTSASHDSDGYYNCELDATDTNTIGQLTIIIHVSGALPCRLDFQIMEEAIYDAILATNATISEMAQGAPPAAATFVQMLNYIYRKWRNKTETTSSEDAIYDDAGTTKLVKAPLSDDGTTFTKNEYGSGA